MPHCTRRAPPARPVASGPAASTPPHVRQAVLNLVWDKLLPAMHSPSPLPADDAAADQLDQSLKALTLRSVTGAASPAADVAGRKYVFPANDRKLASITLEGGVGSNDGTVTLVTRIDGVERRIPCAPGGWQRGCAAWGRLPEQPAAASGAWTAGRHLHGQALLLRDAVRRGGPPDVRRRRSAMQRRVQRVVRPDEGGRTGRSGGVTDRAARPGWRVCRPGEQPSRSRGAGAVRDDRIAARARPHRPGLSASGRSGVAGRI